MQAEMYKQVIARRYNTKVKSRNFLEGDMVQRKTCELHKKLNYGKLAANQEGPFRVVEDLKSGAYQLTYLNDTIIPNTWNASQLKFYFS